MKYYIKADGELIIRAYKTNSSSSDTSISKTKFNKIKWTEGKLYKYINNDIVEEDDPEYINVLKERAIEQAYSDLDADIKKGFEFEGDYYKIEDEDQNNYNSISHKKARLPASLKMTKLDGTFKDIPSNKIDDFTDKAFDQKMMLIQNTKQKVEYIQNVTTINELEAL